MIKAATNEVVIEAAKAATEEVLPVAIKDKKWQLQYSETSK